MKFPGTLFGLIIIAIFIAPSLMAQDKANIDELQTLFDSTRAVEAYAFAPKTFEKAEEKFNKVREAISRGRKQKKVNKLASEFRGYAENAIKQTEVNRITLSDYLGPREKARAAEAQKLVVELYNEAELRFIKGTKKVEDGNSKSGLKEVNKAMPLFDIAELEAIKIQIMGQADNLIRQAETDQALKYAPSTMDKARTARSKSNAILIKDRYERNESILAATQSEYEARHASSIAQSVRSLERNDQAWERLMLLYEIEMQKVGNELGIEQVPFDAGPIGAASKMIGNIKGLKNDISKLEGVKKETASQLTKALGQLGSTAETDDPIMLAEGVNEVIAELASKLDSSELKLASLESTHEKISKELSSRQEKEEKIENARAVLNPTEGEVLLNATDDIVVRLYGLSFSSGSSDITDGHVDLLKKVETVLNLFADSKLMVEGHTDDRGERTTNMRLSEKRAFSVMQYLRKLMTIPADRIDAVGYGPDKPIGTNTTKEGRAKNRRIDILIFQ